MRLAVALADYRSLIGLDIYQDDAFYYLKLAQNVVHGRGLTFDGATPTNGFHPLYLFLLLPILALSGADPIAPIHASALLLAAVAVLTGLLVFGLTRRLAGPAAGLIALAVWALSPYFTVLGINGLETGLAMFFALAAVFAYLEWIRPAGGAPSVRRAAALGVVFGLAALARIDLLLLLAAIGLDWLALALREGRVRAALIRIPVTAALALAVWLPWGILSRAETGAWLPASGSATRQIALAYGWIDLPPVWSGERRARRMRARSSIRKACPRPTTRTPRRINFSCSCSSTRCWRRCGCSCRTRCGPSSSAIRRTPRSAARRGSESRSPRSRWPR